MWDMLIVLRVVVPFPTTNLINNQTATVAVYNCHGISHRVTGTGERARGHEKSTTKGSYDSCRSVFMYLRVLIPIATEEAGTGSDVAQ